MSRSVAFTVPGNPIPKARPRVTFRSGRRPMAYTPARTKGWEAIVADAARLAMRGREPFEGPVVVELWLWRDNLRRADADNMEKAILDACNGIVFYDDDQVADMHRYKRLDRQEPLMAIRVCEVEESELRDRDTVDWMKEFT